MGERMKRSRPGRAIGLLGGSFNPAHDGHRFLSLQALRRLGLDQVWWMVSPQNPLKSADGMADLSDRVGFARRVANHPGIRVTDIEQRLGTRYTVDTVTALRARFPEHRFVWLMGADNLAQMPRWHRWQDLFEMVPIAVFDRAPYSVNAMAGMAAGRYRSRFVRSQAARCLPDADAPCWSLIRMPLQKVSSTEIRAMGGGL